MKKHTKRCANCNSTNIEAQMVATEHGRSRCYDCGLVDNTDNFYDQLELKVRKLKSLLLLTDDSVSNITASDTQVRQWTEFIKCFPEEKANRCNDGS